MHTEEQLIMRVGRGCNYRCIFCNITELNETQLAIKETNQQLIEQFHKKLKLSNITNLGVTISGGEPSIFKNQVYFIVKYIQKYCKNNNIKVGFDMQTNGTEFDKKFIHWLIQNKVDDFLISFHTIDKNIFEKLLGISYNTYFPKVIDTIKTLSQKGAEIELNTIITKINFRSFYDTIKFSIDHFNIKNISITIGVFQPHGYGDKNITKLYIPFSDIYKTYNKVLYIVNNKGIPSSSHYCGLPLCYIDNFNFSIEYKRNLLLRKRTMLTSKFLINKLNDSNKIHTKDCNNCLYNNVCSGIWKEYKDIQKLKPVYYIKDFFNNFTFNSTSYKLKNKNEIIEKLYNKNYKQILIPTTIGNKEEIYKIIEESKKIGFYDISLLVNSKFILEKDIFLTGITNIQIDIENITIDFFTELIIFSDKFKPQFRIDLDIFIKNYNLINIKKIFSIIKRKPLPFIKFFFIYNFRTKDIYQYISLIRILEKTNIKNNIFTINFYKNLLYKQK